MQKIREPLALAKDDHEIIMGYLKKDLRPNVFTRQELEDLKAELKRAKLINKMELPEDVVRLNSTVVIEVEKDKKIMEVMIVTPEKADIKQRKISIMSPIGTALIGFRKGNKISWKVPGGKKTFRILDVRNPVA